MTARRFNCPQCGQKAAVAILYGFPGPDMADEAERGEIVLGGCIAEIGAPDRHCLNCGHRWPIARRGGRAPG